MRPALLALATVLGLLVAAPGPASAQATGTEAAPSKPAKPSRAAKPQREPTAGQLAGRERRRKCGVEWKEAKQAGTTGGLKWPQFYSRCNTRLKGNNV
ncbi:hypothetical protein [Enterovirga sp.]|jgi:hypothetical protein|uniref:hypothetical protein n=1 Tax=Enterovirga sp. TaxID=2026350 RepID=UPI002638173F|nr:hypothetical protein [Enterovirga sp.]MDB5589690.1 hypothetical protein [Enterovirga sp.]